MQSLAASGKRRAISGFVVIDSCIMSAQAMTDLIICTLRASAASRPPRRRSPRAIQFSVVSMVAMTYARLPMTGGASFAVGPVGIKARPSRGLGSRLRYLSKTHVIF